MTESNLSKSDLLEICSSLGLPTEGNKMDLVHKLKEYSGVINRGKGKEKDVLAGPSTLGQEIADDASIRKSLAEEGPSGSLEDKVLLGFEKLENALLKFDEKLNAVTRQVQETKQKAEHEYDALRSIGKELDLAMESRTTTDVANHINFAREKTEDRMFTLRVASVSNEPRFKVHEHVQ
ncbi:4109_t:CDS:2, partial [Dentiscutata heterogama]